jgi:putative ABC transport system substrate-binding protein
MTIVRAALGAALALDLLAAGGLLADAQSWAPLRLGLRDLGYVEGRSIAFEERSSQGRNDRFPGLASDLVRANVNIIVTWGTPAALAAKKATTAIPIVMASAGDPARNGAIASLARPGGNVTGLTGTRIRPVASFGINLKTGQLSV